MREKNPVAKRLPHELVSHAVSRTHGISFGSRAADIADGFAALEVFERYRSVQVKKTR